MDFALTPTTVDLGQAARKFASETLASDVVDRDRRGGTDPTDWQDLWKAAADYGLLGLATPKEFGGSGYDVQTAVHVMQQIGYGCLDGGLTLGLNAQIWSMQMPILEFGTSAQKDRILPKLIDGSMICAHAITEEKSGSDAMSLTTTAQKVDGGYLLNGTKSYIGMATACDLAMVFATSNPEHGVWGVSAFLVDAHSKGFVRGTQKQKMGTRTLPFGSIELKDCLVPEEALLGKTGSGNAIFNRSLEWERRFIFSSQTGAMQRQLDECVSYSKEREVFDAPINSFQSVSNRLADMKLRLETAQLMLWRAAWEADQGISNMANAAATKLHLSEAYLASSVDAMRIFGGKGYLEESGAERATRDALGGITYGGTSDIQRQIIASELIRQ